MEERRGGGDWGRWKREEREWMMVQVRTRYIKAKHDFKLRTAIQPNGVRLLGEPKGSTREAEIAIKGTKF